MLWRSSECPRQQAAVAVITSVASAEGAVWGCNRCYDAQLRLQPPLGGLRWGQKNALEEVPLFASEASKQRSLAIPKDQPLQEKMGSTQGK